MKWYFDSCEELNRRFSKTSSSNDYYKSCEWLLKLLKDAEHRFVYIQYETKNQMILYKKKKASRKKRPASSKSVKIKP